MTTAFCPSCGAAAAGAFCAGCGASLGGQPARATATGIAWGGAIIVIAGALAMLGAFLPWITATGGFGATASRNGIDGGGDGIVAIVLGILIALLGVAILSGSGRSKTARVGAFICALALGAVAVIDLGSINDRVKTIEAGSTAATAAVGTGIIVVLLAAVLAGVGSLLPTPRRG